MQLQNFESASIDEASAILNRAWSRHAITPQKEGFRLQFRHRRLGEDVSLSALCFGAETGVRPGARDDVVLLNMPLRGTARILDAAGETICSPSRYAMIDVRSVQEARFSADFEALVLRIRRDRLHAHLGTALGARPKHDLAFARAMVAGTTAWRDWAPVAALLRGLAEEGGDVPWRLAPSLEETVVSALLLSHPNTYAEALRRPAAPILPRHVRLAVEHARANPGAPLTTRALACHAGVSVRTLFNGFQSFTGLTPAEYVRRTRLEGARAALLAGEGPPATVARRWGFRHPAHFAALYRARYGEAPSRTVAALPVG